MSMPTGGMRGLKIDPLAVMFCAVVIPPRDQIDEGSIVNALRAHPLVRDARVHLRLDSTGRPRVDAFVLPTSNIQLDSTAATAIDRAHVAKWRKLSEVSYSNLDSAVDPRANVPARADLNLAGWTSSYTGQPLPEWEMAEWVEQGVQRIRSFGAKRILEIGCGTGLLLFRVAPYCEEYWATDFSSRVMDYVQRHVSAQSYLAHVNLRRAAAEDFDALPQGHFDLVLLNSVVQYFPGWAYLADVISKSLRALRPGGVVFIGDVKDLGLLEAFQLSVVLHQAGDEQAIKTLRALLPGRMEMNSELAVAPRFFRLLGSHLPMVSEVVVQPRRGRARNEMNRFRYDAWLRIGSGHGGRSVEHRDWPESWTLQSLEHHLRSMPASRCAFKSIPNRRTVDAIRALEAFRRADDATSVGDFRKLIPTMPAHAMDPQDLWDLGEALGRRIHIDCSTHANCGTFDLISEPQGEDLATDLPSLDPLTLEKGDAQDLSYLTNDPARKTRLQAMEAPLLEFLRSKVGSQYAARVIVVEDFPPAAS